MIRQVRTARPILPPPDRGAEVSFTLQAFRARRVTIATIPLASLIVTVAAGSIGCRPGYQHVSPVKGRVTLDGIPLAQAQVMFLPDTGRPSTGETNAEGVYELAYTFKQKGAEHGLHTVRVTTAYTRQDYTVGQERVPKMYNEQSTLRKEVRQGRNAIDLELVSSPRPKGPADTNKE